VKYKIVPEYMGGDLYHMIYCKTFLFPWAFFERWNTKETAEIRLNELRA